MGIAYVDASQFPSLISAETLADSTTLYLKRAKYGDSNRDGKVDATDFQMFLDGLAATNGSSWSQGDYTYDGRVDLGNDFNLFLPGIPRARLITWRSRPDYSKPTLTFPSLKNRSSFRSFPSHQLRRFC